MSSWARDKKHSVLIMLPKIVLTYCVKLLNLYLNLVPNLEFKSQTDFITCVDKITHNNWEGNVCKNHVEHQFREKLHLNGAR